MLSNLLLCLIVLFTTIHCQDGDDAVKTKTPKPPAETSREASVELSFASVESVQAVESTIGSLSDKIKSLSDNIDSAHSKCDEFNSKVGKQIEDLDSSHKQRFTNLESSGKVLDERFGAIDESLSQQGKQLNDLTQSRNEDVSNSKQRLDSFGNELKNVENKIDRIDLSKYVSLNDFNNAQKEINSLKSQLTKVSNENSEMKTQLSQLSQLSQLEVIREELNQLKKLESLTSLVKSNEALEREVDTLKKEIGKMNKNSATMDKRLTQVGRGTGQTNIEIERLKEDFDSVRQELVDLESLVHLVKAQTIGTMIETGYETCQKVVQIAIRIVKEKGTVAMELGQEYGTILLEKLRVLSTDFVNIVKTQFFIYKEKIVNYDYSWLTDENNWRLLANHFKRMWEVTNEWTREQIIPAIKQQSTQHFQEIRDFVTDLYEHRRNNQIYQQVQLQVMPLLKQIEALPREYYSLTMDVVMVSLSFFVLLCIWFLLWIVCQCLCPKVPKIEDNGNHRGQAIQTGQARKAPQQQQQQQQQKQQQKQQKPQQQQPQVQQAQQQQQELKQQQQQTQQKQQGGGKKHGGKKKRKKGN